MTLPTYQQVKDAQDFIDSLPMPIESNVVVIDESNNKLVEFIESRLHEMKKAVYQDIEDAIHRLQIEIDLTISISRKSIQHFINDHAQDLIKNK